MPDEYSGEVISSTKLTPLAKVIAFCATGPGFLAAGAVLNYVHGPKVLPTVAIVYGAILSLYGSIATGYAGFRRERWMITKADPVKWGKILKSRDEKIGELYEKIDQLEESLSLEKAVAEKLSNHILGERKGGKKPKKLKEAT